MVEKKDNNIPEFLLDTPSSRVNQSEEQPKLTVLVKDALATEISKEGSLKEREVGYLEKGIHEVKKVFSGDTYSKEIETSPNIPEPQESKGFIESNNEFS